MCPFEITADLAVDFLRRTFDAAWIIDEESRIVFANAAAERLTGYQVDKLIGKPLALLLPPSLTRSHDGLIRSYFARSDKTSSVLDRTREFTIVDRSGEEVPVELMAFELAEFDGQGHLGALMRDIRDQRAFERRRDELIREMSDLARTDELTGLLNRRAFLSRLEEAKGLINRHARPLVVALADVDQFKRINDTFGHEAGDRTLQVVAKVMRSSLRNENVVGRLGGDEFGLLFPECDVAQAQQAADQLRASIAETRVLVSDADWSSLTISVGLADLRPGAETIKNALRRADGALYEAKAVGRNCVMVSEDLLDLEMASGAGS